MQKQVLCDGKLIPKTGYSHSDDHGEVLGRSFSRAESLDKNWTLVYNDGDLWEYDILWMNVKTGKILKCCIVCIRQQYGYSYWDDFWREIGINDALRIVYPDRTAINNILKYAKEDCSDILARLEKEHRK